MQNFNNGPDQIKPTNDVCTSNPNLPVSLKLARTGEASRKPFSIPTLLANAAQQWPNVPAMSYKKNQDNVNVITFSQVKDQVYHFTKVFIKLGLTPRHTVSILSANTPQWVISSLATIHAGGISSGIDPEDTEITILNQLQISRTNIVIVDSDEQLEKITIIRNDATYLRAIIQTSPSQLAFDRPIPGYYTWEELESWDVLEYQGDFDYRLRQMCINECCILGFTSTGMRKERGVMLQHDNITWTAEAIVEILSEVSPGQESIICYAPLFHIAPQIIDIYVSLTIGMTVHFSDEGKLMDTIIEVKPTRLSGVPKVYERMYKCFISDDLGRLEDPINLREKALYQGLGNCKSLICGTATFATQTKEFFISNGLPLMDAYGLPESSGFHIFAPSKVLDANALGESLRGCESRLRDVSEEKYGEMFIRGRNIFMGYIDMERATKETIDEEGWLYTGDVGFFNIDSVVVIARRKKDYDTSFNRNDQAPPIAVQYIREELPILRNVYVFGIEKNFPTALVTLKSKIDPKTGRPTDEPAPVVDTFLKELDLEYTSITELIDAGPDRKFMLALDQAIERVNQRITVNNQKIKRIHVLYYAYSATPEELGPALRIRHVEINGGLHHRIQDIFD